MTKEDIELTVLTTMAEATASSPERNHLLTRVESARFNELIRFERKKQVLLRMALYVLVGILVLTALQPLAPPLASLPSQHQVTSLSHSATQPWWQFWDAPAKTPPERHSP